MTTSFNDLMKNIIKPYFKKKGFSSKGLSFYKTTSDIIFLFDFQKSQGNTPTQTKCYINVGIHAPVIEEIIGATVHSAPKEYECYFRKRISVLTGADQDGFYITEQTDIQVLGETLTDDLEKVMDQLEAIRSTEQLCDLMIRENGLHHYNELLKYFVATRDTERINNHLATLHKKFGEDKRWPVFERNLDETLKALTPVTTVESILAGF